MASTSVYEIITDRVVALLEAGTVPWRKPWRAGSAATGDGDGPRNLKGRPYRGINVFLLLAAGYTDPRWGTFKQLAEAGATVRKGEKGTPVIFWKKYEVEDPEAKNGKRSVPVLRYYTVFNVEQTEGKDWGIAPGTTVGNAETDGDFGTVEACEAIVDNMPNRPAIRHAAQDRAFYSPMLDSITLPARSQFASTEEYYSTLFHELTHSTGHKSRCDREKFAEGSFGTHNYGREELVAEMGNAFLCAAAGIEPATLDNSAAYIASWVRTIKEDVKAVVTAAGKAQRAADYILGALDAEAYGEVEEEVAA